MVSKIKQRFYLELDIDSFLTISTLHDLAPSLALLWPFQSILLRETPVFVTVMAAIPSDGLLIIRPQFLYKDSQSALLAYRM